MTLLAALPVASATLAVDDSKVTPGIVGFLVVFAIGIATWLLIRSMNTQLRKVDFDEGEPAPGETAAEDPGSDDPGSAPPR